MRLMLDNCMRLMFDMHANHVLVHTSTGVECIYSRRSLAHTSSTPGSVGIHDEGRRTAVEGVCMITGSRERVSGLVDIY